MDCANCFKAQLAECPDLIRVYAGLTPNSLYSWLIKDVHGAEWYELVTTNSFGGFEIDAALFPEGLLNRHAGTFTLQIFEYYQYDYYSSEALSISFCDVEYDSICFEFVKKSSTLDQSIQYVKCGPDGSSGSGNGLDNLLWT